MRPHNSHSDFKDAGVNPDWRNTIGGMLMGGCGLLGGVSPADDELRGWGGAGMAQQQQQRHYGMTDGALARDTGEWCSSDCTL